MAKHQGIQHVPPKHLLLGRSRRLMGMGKGIDDVILAGGKWRANVSNEVTAASLTRSIDEATTLAITCQDSRGQLLRSPLLEGRYEIELDGLHFVLTQISKSGDQLTLTHEAKNIARLRRHEGKKKAYRDKITRAEFVYSLIREASNPRIPAYIPELHKEQPIEEPDVPDPKTQVSIDGGSRGEGGIDKGAKVTVKGQAANSEQRKIGERSLAIAESLHAPWQAAAALIVAEIDESQMMNLDYGDADSLGVLQVRAGIFGAAHAKDVEWCVHYFLTKGFTGAGSAISLAKQGMSPAAIAARVQGGVGPYSPYVDEAMKWLKAFKGSGGSSGFGGSVSTTRTIEKRYAFERKKKEDSWTCIRRLGEEVNWRAFEAANIIYYVSEPRLLQGKIAMRLTHGEDSAGVDAIDFDMDQGKDVQELTVAARAEHWAAPPGTPAIIEEMGPANGTYLVSEIEMDLLDRADTASVTLKKREKPLPEPAPETKEQTKTNRFQVSGRGGGGDLNGTKLNTSLGAPHWGGSADVMQRIVYPIAKKLNMTIGAKKEGGHAVGGDHDPSITNAFATDFPPGSGHFANAVARHLGIEHYHSGDFTHWTFHAGGETFGCQILWQVEDHYDHVHVGIRHGGY